MSLRPGGAAIIGGPGGRGRPLPRWREQQLLPGRRLFVGVPLPDPVRDEVARLIERVRSAVTVDRIAEGREVRWVRVEGLHLTLRFLGPTLDERRPAVEAAIRAAAAGARPFPVRISGGGAFPSPARPRVLWLGVSAGAEQLTALAEALEAGLEAAGWPPEERPFRPHLTLARADGVRAGPATAQALVAAAERFSAEWVADRVILFESHTGGGPARYEALLEVPFGA